MRNYLLLTINILLFTFLLCGCSVSKDNENVGEKNNNEVAEKSTTEQINKDIPEPYSKAIKAINGENWELADTYLDLVISDFPDSEYVLAAQILKGSMQLSQFKSAYDLSEILFSADPSSSLLDADERETLNSHFDLIKEIFEEFNTEQEVTFTNILKNFKVEKDYSKYYKKLSPLLIDSASNNLSFFENVGYPIPTDSDIDKFLNTNFDINMSYYINALTGDPEHLNYNFLLFFSNAGMSIYEPNPILAKELFNIVLEITSDDIYNEFRIPVEKVLKDSNFEDNQNEELNTNQDNIEADNNNASNHEAFVWGDGIKDEFENKMIQNEYADSKDNLIYKNGFIGDDNQGYYEVYTINENGEEQYIVVVNVKTGWYHG